MGKLTFHTASDLARLVRASVPSVHEESSSLNPGLCDEMSHALVRPSA